MKYSLPFTLFLFWLAPLPATGAEILDRRIEVNFSNVPLAQALTEIARLAQFEWSYNAKIIDKEARATLDARDWPVREVLYTLLGDGYQFKPNGNYLILKKQKQPADELSGYLKDPASGKRIAGATVYDKRTLRATTTDRDGYYRLKVRENSEVVVTKLAYRDTILRVESTSSRIQNLELNSNPVPPAPAHRSIRADAHYVGAQLEDFFRTGLQDWDTWNVRDSLHRRAQISLLPGVGSNHTLSGEVSNQWSVNIIAGVSKNVEGLELGGIANFTREDVRGAQIGGVLNSARGNTEGIQMAGILNLTGDTLVGAQFGGVFNRAAVTRETAIQMAGIFNKADQTEGITLQAAGILNLGSNMDAGVQLAGIVNSADTIQGVQASGVYNICTRIKGVQFGLFNKATECKGFQIGVINTAGKVSGLQFGLINKTKERSGFQFGAFNKNGRKKRLLLNW